MHVSDTNVEKEVKGYGLTSHGEVTFEELMDELYKKKAKELDKPESSFNVESEINHVKSFKAFSLFGSLTIDQEMEDADEVNSGNRHKGPKQGLVRCVIRIHLFRGRDQRLDCVKRKFNHLAHMSSQMDFILKCSRCFVLSDKRHKGPKQELVRCVISIHLLRGRDQRLDCVKRKFNHLAHMSSQRDFILKCRFESDCCYVVGFKDIRFSGCNYIIRSEKRTYAMSILSPQHKQEKYFIFTEDELISSVDERDGFFSSTSPRVSKPAFTVSFGGNETQYSLGFNLMTEENTSRSKDKGGWELKLAEDDRVVGEVEASLIFVFRESQRGKPRDKVVVGIKSLYDDVGINAAQVYVNTALMKVPRNQDNKHKKSLRRIVPVETPTSTTLVSCDGLGGYDWSDQVEEGPNYALMAFSSSSSDSKVSNDSTCSKSCLETIELLKSQNDQQLKDLKKSELMVLGYKTCLESVEERLEFYKTNECIYLEDIKVLKVEIQIGEIAIRELRKKLEIAQKEKDGIQLNVDKFEHASKSLNKLIECQIVNNYKKGLDYVNYNTVPPPYIGNFLNSTPELSFIGLDEFVNKLVVENCKARSSEEVPKVVRKNDDTSIIKEWVSGNEEEDVSQPKIEKKTVRPSMAKIEFVKSKHQEKIARKTVKQVEQHRPNTHSPRGNKRN
nr:hypothetical protein [Tanacetum cinerariifolium]